MLLTIINHVNWLIITHVHWSFFLIPNPLMVHRHARQTCIPSNRSEIPGRSAATLRRDPVSGAMPRWTASGGRLGANSWAPDPPLWLLRCRKTWHLRWGIVGGWEKTKDRPQHLNAKTVQLRCWHWGFGFFVAPTIFEHFNIEIRELGGYVYCSGFDFVVHLRFSGSIIWHDDYQPQ